MATIITINIYKAWSKWCYSAWTSYGFDHSDTLGCPDDTPDSEAHDEAAWQFPEADIARVADVSE